MAEAGAAVGAASAWGLVQACPFPSFQAVVAVADVEASSSCHRDGVHQDLHVALASCRLEVLGQVHLEDFRIQGLLRLHRRERFQGIAFVACCVALPIALRDAVVVEASNFHREFSHLKRMNNIS